MILRRISSTGAAGSLLTRNILAPRAGRWGLKILSTIPVPRL